MRRYGTLTSMAAHLTSPDLEPIGIVFTGPSAAEVRSVVNDWLRRASLVEFTLETEGETLTVNFATLRAVLVTPWEDAEPVRRAEHWDYQVADINDTQTL